MRKLNTKSILYAKSNQKGITLIALIVTIIVLLILSGVTIANISGGETPIEKAKQAKDETAIREEMEEIQTAINNSSIKGIRHGNYSGSIDAASIKAALSNLVTDSSVITGNGPWQVTGSKTGEKYVITESYELIPFSSYEQH